MGEGEYKLTLGKDVTLNTMRAACLSMSKDDVVVEPLHRWEPGINVVRVDNFEPKQGAHVSLRLNPVRPPARDVRFAVNKEEFRRLRAGFPRKEWPSHNCNWVEARADDAVYKAGDRVHLWIRYSECIPGDWIFGMMDAFAEEFDARDIVLYRTANRAWLRKQRLP